MVSVEELRTELVESDGFEVIERLRAFDNSYHAFKKHHVELVDAIQRDEHSQYELSRRFIAYSGSIAPLRDQAHRLYKQLTDRSDERYREKLRATVDLQVSDFLIELRHYVQHTHVPFLVSPANVSPRCRLETTSVPEGVHLHVPELRARGRDFKKDRARRFLDRRDVDLVPLEPILTQYFGESAEFNEWVTTQCRSANETEISEARTLQRRILETTEE